MARLGRKVRPGRKHRQDEPRRGGDTGPPPLIGDVRLGLNALDNYTGSLKDTFIRGGANSDTNYSTHANLLTKYGGLDNEFTSISLITVDLAEIIAILEVYSRNLTAAALVLYNVANESGMPANQFNIYSQQQAWELTEVTWHNKTTGPDVPWTFTSSLWDHGRDMPAVYVTAGQVDTSPIYLEFSSAGILAHIAAVLDDSWTGPEGVASFQLHHEQNDNFTFNSSRSADGTRPYLKLTFEEA